MDKKKSYTAGPGRLGNQLIRNICFQMLIEKLGIILFKGKKKFDVIIQVTEENYKDIYNKKNISCSLYTDSYFQTTYFTDIVYNFLRRDNIKEKIIYCNPFKERYQNNKDIFIHFRLGDVTHYYLSMNYIETIIENLDYNSIYISTDSPCHNSIINFKNKHDNVKIYEDDEIKTFQFGSTCKYIILSQGTFSAVIGYLAFFSEKIFYPKNVYGWYPLEIYYNKGFTEIDNKNI